jgi:hypothetical protein
MGCTAMEIDLTSATTTSVTGLAQAMVFLDATMPSTT